MVWWRDLSSQSTRTETPAAGSSRPTAVGHSVLCTHKAGKILLLKSRAGGIGETSVLKEKCKTAFYLA
ncbi:uncharacterized protein N7518_006755 [Penicillium psychrosexuale]|uniref:uncharacterized protein n=1 Tax=Penicillium psychrosexuale TaxID=1002107 RepID=UPI002544EBCB|nr:uncharacterized protein N7518_006755 [Penicillium psychrosexuale]KAJ5789744.1 hypothetical protein N7518_006755 [Penicillium psychrosexuale]